MQQHEQSSVLMQEHLPPCGLPIEPVEIEEVVEAGIMVYMRFFWVCANYRCVLCG
tara:strand:- start:2900 stop:3064 length:165 start_codon:yes stop_codon:yes gene_type:complete